MVEAFGLKVVGCVEFSPQRDCVRQTCLELRDYVYLRR